jgi:hypothetical protein
MMAGKKGMMAKKEIQDPGLRHSKRAEDASQDSEKVPGN